MEDRIDQIRETLEMTVLGALERSAELIQEIQDPTLKSPYLEKIRRASLMATLSATWGQSHLAVLEDFARQAGVLTAEEQIVGIKARKEKFTLIAPEKQDPERTAIYLKEEDLRTIFVSLGGDPQMAEELFSTPDSPGKR